MRATLLVFGCLFLQLLFTESRRIVKFQDERIYENINETTIDDQHQQSETSHLRRNLFFSTSSQKDPSLHKVTSLPGLKTPINFNHYAGLIPLDSLGNNQMFYWLIESPTDSATKPLIIWMNGGPGCSSMDGLWLELGPFRLAEDRQTVKLNPFSWHLAANILFVDQPVGTGFSYTKLKNGHAKNDDMINTQFYSFLKNFLNLHRRYISTDPTTKQTNSRPIFLTGESHAGHFIPTISSYILQRNEEISRSPPTSSEDVIITISGIALGNPWIDPINQYNPAEYAHGLGLLTRGQVNKIKEQDYRCRKLIHRGTLNSNTCINILDYVLDAATVPGHHRLLMYDIRKFLTNPSIFPLGHEALESYLNRRDVRQALHTLDTPHRFQECTDPPYFALAHQDAKGVMPEIKSLLENGIEMLVFNGQYDLICNHLNIETALDIFNWTGLPDWLLSRPGIWSLNKRPTGYIRKARNLQSLLSKYFFFFSLMVIYSFLIVCFSFILFSNGCWSHGSHGCSRNRLEDD
jgi:carboxypeptidase D